MPTTVENAPRDFMGLKALSQNIQHNLADALGLYGGHENSNSAERTQSIMAFWAMDKDIRAKEILNALLAYDKGEKVVAKAPDQNLTHVVSAPLGSPPREEAPSIPRGPDPVAFVPDNGQSSAGVSHYEEEPTHLDPDPLDPSEEFGPIPTLEPAPELEEDEAYSLQPLLQRLEVLEGMMARSEVIQEVMVCVLSQFIIWFHRAGAAKALDIPDVLTDVAASYKKGIHFKFLMDKVMGSPIAPAKSPPAKSTDAAPRAARRKKGK